MGILQIDSVMGIRIRGKTPQPILLGLVTVAIVVRLLALDFLTDDVRHYVIPWYDYMRDHGFPALGGPVPSLRSLSANYSPPYYYLLLLASALDDFAPELYLIKATTIIFDFLAAFFMYRLVLLRGSPRHAWAAFFCVLFAPTVMANGALWGQADIIPTSFVVGSVYFAVARRPLWAIILLSVALSIKATPLFLMPFILVLVLRSAIPWRQLLLVPVVYVFMMMPALLAGRPLLDIVTIYARQGSLYQHLSMNAPNWYFFISDKYYEPVVVVGISVTIIVSLIFSILPTLKKIALTPRFLLLSATLSVVLVPFLLPKMHDRYFFAGDLLSIGLAFYDRKLWYIPLLSQVSSILAYVPIISEAYTGIDDGYRALMPLAVLVNTLLLGLLIREYWLALNTGITLENSDQQHLARAPMQVPG